MAMRPNEQPEDHPARALLSVGRFLCRSDPPGQARAHHSRAFRSCPIRATHPYWRRWKPCGIMKRALWRGLRRADRDRRSWRKNQDRGTLRCGFIQPGMCLARRRSRSRLSARASLPQATTSARATQPACPSRWCLATCSSRRRPSACRCSNSAIRASRST